MTIIRAENIVKSFRSGGNIITVLDGVNISVEKGDMIAIMGVSGSGKSTLLHILGLINQPDEGTVEFLSQKIDYSKEDTLSVLRGKHIGFVFQFYSLIGELTIKENIVLPAMISKTLYNLDKVRRILELVGLDMDKATRLPSMLSGGELQRAALARALINDPDIIIADEPTANLDKASSIDIVNTMAQINSHTGQTFIIATHSQDVAQRCKKVLYLTGGKLREEI